MKTKLILTLALLLPAARLVGADANANGLSDVYEFIYFHGPVDPAGDPDSDGSTTLDEMIWGTDPTRAASKVTGAAAHVDGPDLVLTWPAAEGKWYRLQACADLQTWQTVAEGHIATHRESLDADGVKFWRVQVFGNTPDADGNGFDDWEEDLWKKTYGKSLGESDIDGDGLRDAEEFQTGHEPGKQDHPAVGLVVFTPLEK